MAGTVPASAATLPPTFCCKSSSSALRFRQAKDRVSTLRGPIACDYGVDAIDAAHNNQWCGTNIYFSRRNGSVCGWRMLISRRHKARSLRATEKGYTREGARVWTFDDPRVGDEQA